MSPWVFYVIDIVHSLRIVTVIISGVSVAAVLAIFLPSNETMVQMLVAATGTDIDHIRQIEEVTKAILLR